MATRPAGSLASEPEDSPRDLHTVKDALKRGAYLVAANWQVILVQFGAESTFKLLLAVPVVGGAVLVAAAVGHDLTDLLAGGWRQMLAGIGGALLAHPAALGAFGFAFLSAVLGGSVLMFLIKGGTVSILIHANRAAGPIERPPLRMAAFQRAAQFSINGFLAGAGYVFRRYLMVGVGLLSVYALSAAFYVAVVLSGYRLIDSSGLLVGWTMAAAALATVLIVWITVVNLVYLLVQMIVAADDVSPRVALREVWRFVRSNFGDVAAIFAVLLLLVVLATIASILATAALGLISFVPLVGLAVFPLQVLAWLVRGLVFQYLGLTAFGAYLALYTRSRSRAERAAPASTWVRTA
jgi:hypothetical protein